MAMRSSIHTQPFFMWRSFQKLCMWELIWRHLCSLSVSTQSLISLRIAYFDVRLAIKEMENIFKAKLKASVYKSVDGEVSVVVSVFGVDGFSCTDGAVDGPASSKNRTFESVESFNCMSVSSSEFDIINTLWKLLASRWK